MWPEIALSVVWGTWVLSWIVASAWSGQTVKRAGLGEALSYRIPTVAGAALMVAFSASGEPGNRLYPPPPGAGSWLLVALVALGCLFAWWARLHLGALWSSSVTRKAEHRIVDTGPYRIVRHPIYTGLIFALLATAAVLATAGAFAGVALMIAGFVIKARLEERFLHEAFGPEVYEAYARRVPMLVPLWPQG